MFVRLFIKSVLLITVVAAFAETPPSSARIELQDLSKFFEATGASRKMLTEINKVVEKLNVDQKKKVSLRGKLYWGLIEMHRGEYLRNGIAGENLKAITKALESPTGIQYFKVVRPGQLPMESVVKAVRNPTPIKLPPNTPDIKDFVRLSDILGLTSVAREAIQHFLKKEGRESHATAVNQAFANMAAATVIEFSKIGMTKSGLKTMVDQVEQAQGAKICSLFLKQDLKKSQVLIEEIIKKNL